MAALVLASCGGGRTLVPPGTAPPSSRDALRAIEAHADVDPPDPSCTNIPGDLSGETLGAIETHLLAQLADAQAGGDPARLTVACDPAGPPWRCRFEVSIETEDPWRYAIVFTLDAVGAIDASSITCPGQ